MSQWVNHERHSARQVRIPEGVSLPLVKPSYIEDVPILSLTFWEDEDHYILRRVAAEVEDLVKA